MGSGIQVVIIIKNSTLMGLQMRRRIKRENMVLVIKFMSKYLAIKRPAKGVRQHAGEQHKHDGIDMVALVHDVKIVYPDEEYHQFVSLALSSK
jgi:hypothetical protein